MKKIISIALIFSILAPFWISFSLIQYEKFLVKKEIKELIISGLPLEKLTLLKFTKAEIEEELEWEDSKEFEYDGTMYDIVECDIKKDSVFYWCWKDDDETDLNCTLNKLVGNEIEGSDKTEANLKIISNFFANLYFSQNSLINFPFNKEKRFYSNFLLNYLSFKTRPSIPPPKILSV